jgi:hypothetical protein
MKVDLRPSHKKRHNDFGSQNTKTKNKKRGRDRERKEKKVDVPWEKTDWYTLTKKAFHITVSVYKYPEEK